MFAAQRKLFLDFGEDEQLKDMLLKAKLALAPLGFKKSRHRFWAIDNRIYRLIDFQRGAYGNYFFVNLGIHPVGLPMLIAGRLSIPDKPSESKCILRVRFDRISGDCVRDMFRSGYVSYSDAEAVDRVIDSIVKEGVQWLDYWGNLSILAHSSDAELQDKLSVVPLVREKATAMLRFYAFHRIGEFKEAANWLNTFRDISTPPYEFSEVEEYLDSLLSY